MIFPCWLLEVRGHRSFTPKMSPISRFKHLYLSFLTVSTGDKLFSNKTEFILAGTDCGLTFRVAKHVRLSLDQRKISLLPTVHIYLWNHFKQLMKQLLAVTFYQVLHILCDLSYKLCSFKTNTYLLPWLGFCKKPDQLLDIELKLKNSLKSQKIS